MRRRLSLPACCALAAVAVVAGACSGDDERTLPFAPTRATEPPGDATAPPPGTPPGTDPPVQVQLASRLAPFDACDDLLGWIRSEASERVGPYGLEGRYWMEGDVVFDDMAETTAAGADAASPAAEGSGTTGQGGGTAATNVQEEGVDEPDLVKVDGDRVVALRPGALDVLSVAGGEPTLVATVDLPAESWATGLLLAGDRALVLTTTSGATPAANGVWSEVAVLHLVDLAAPGGPSIVETLQVDGAVVDARMVDGSVRLVLRSQPVGFEWVHPEGFGLQAEREAEEANRALVAASTIERWVPYAVREVDGVTVDEGPLLDCADVRHPAEFSGFGMLDVLTFDLADPTAGLDPVDATGVLAGAETVYGTADSLYVTTTTWVDPESWDPDEPLTTDVHRFDVADPADVRYAASGRVTGWVFDQFALSEHEGMLRIATTTGDPWGGDSESGVTVLAQDGEDLVTVGHVGGLGRDEQIYSVRFIGDLGYVVTFRQTDPLYVIDLSDPTAPAEVGELELLGYSAYLHPVGDGRLLGVGQDADESGVVSGTQVSLFDVSDPAHPVRIAQHTESGVWSEAEVDHHAFLHWAPTGLTVLPVSQWSWDQETGRDTSTFGAVALSVTPSGIAEVGTLTHQDGQGGSDPTTAIRRALVVDGVLVTVSDVAVETHDLASLADLGHADR